MPDVKLIIGGLEYSGWKEVSVSRSMDAMAGKFDLSLSDRWQTGAQAIPLYPEQECQLLLDGQPVITGFIDAVMPSFDAGQHGIRVTGRDRTADLVDCSAIHSPGELLGQDLAQIIRVLCKPFGLDLFASIDVGKAFKTFKLQPGETNFEAIDRACRQRGVLPSSDVRGRVILASIGSDRADALIQGENILKASANHSTYDRFSEYIVTGQQQGTNDTFGLAASAVRATAKDEGVLRHRPLQIMAETQATPESARERAGWEANVRAAKSSEVSITVQGWRMSDGRLWQVNAMSRVQSDFLRVDQDLIIKSVNFSLGSGGTLTSLTLCRKDAFVRKPEAKKDVSALPDLLEPIRKAADAACTDGGYGR
ncbi:MAG: phage tail protein [Pseudodesulfovibrio sp.]|nr:phage tail protein [Pseudodesulfovibrio sp.]